MEPLLTLKRPREVDLDACIFCEEGNKPKNSLRDGGEKGLISVKNATRRRKQLKDSKKREVIERLEDIFSRSDELNLYWHRSCYSEYTNKTKIDRLEASQSHRENTAASFASRLDSAAAGSHTPRSRVKPMDWSSCIFCQQVKLKDDVRHVMTFPMSHQILEAAQYDHTFALRLANVPDLRAAKAKYHLPCFTAFKRSTRIAKDASKDNGLAMVWLCNELVYAAEKGHVIQLNDAWERYVTLCIDSGNEIPRSFMSRHVSFKEQLQSKLEGVVQFIKPLETSLYERQMLLVPCKFVNCALTHHHPDKDAIEDDMLTMPMYEPEEDIFLSLIHVGLKIRGDLLAHPGHPGLTASDEAALDCVPDSLYMLLRIIYGGQKVLDEEEAEDEEVVARRKVLSTAQDIVYGVRGVKKRTPKHIGFGCTLHQAT